MNKPEVGQKLYSLNVGNAARGHEQKLSPMIVSKVGRKYFTCHPEGHTHESKFHLDGWSEKTEYMSRHCLYESKEEWELDKKTSELMKKVKSYFSGYGKIELDLNQLEEIDKIISK